jgi:broad specificity phosphatase PhoE
MAIVLVRHAETALNAARTLQPFDTPLSERGQEQAARLAERMVQQWRPVLILSSDAPRAWQTAEPIAARCALEILADPGLRERDFGALRGQPYDRLNVDPLSMDEAPPGGESRAAFQTRTMAAFERVLERARMLPDADLIVVSHGLWIRTVIETQFDAGGPDEPPLVLGNTSVTLLAAGPPARLLMAGCAAHLEPRLAARGIAGL